MELLQGAAKSEKKDKKLPGVVFDLLQVSLKEGAFELFWKEGVEKGLLKEKSGPVRFVLTFLICCFPYSPSVSCPILMNMAVADVVTVAISAPFPSLILDLCGII